MNQPNINKPGSLGDAFGTSAAGLGGLLPPNRPPAPPPPPVEDASSTAGETAEATPSTRRRAPSADTSRLGTEDDTFPVNVYLLPAAITEASRRRRSRRVDNYELVVDAIDSLRDELPALVARRQSGPGRREDSLFPPRRGASTTASAARDGRRRLWAFQATEAETAVLDKLVDDVGARSRSELVSCALEAFLLPRRRR
ncbi:hypothetical protein ACFXJ8_39275 [Nonomuraea sp. NPDC059194]|uniref:hypothetical protein n=1 Tax=Nonomuraea sp. NPDC059194 TaxID=3346764 RepID=UPI0036821496